MKVWYSAGDSPVKTGSSTFGSLTAGAAAGAAGDAAGEVGEIEVCLFVFQIIPRVTSDP